MSYKELSITVGGVRYDKRDIALGVVFAVVAYGSIAYPAITKK